MEAFNEQNKYVLEDLKKKWAELANNLMEVNDKLKSFEKKTQNKIRKEIQKKIDEIPKRVKRF